MTDTYRYSHFVLWLSDFNARILLTPPIANASALRANAQSRSDFSLLCKSKGAVNVNAEILYRFCFGGRLVPIFTPKVRGTRFCAAWSSCEYVILILFGRNGRRECPLSGTKNLGGNVRHWGAKLSFLDLPPFRPHYFVRRKRRAAHLALLLNC